MHRTTLRRHEVDHLSTQIRRLECRSGKRAASVCVSAPPEVDPEELVQALRSHLDNHGLEIAIDGRPGDSKVITIDFALVRDRDR